MSSLGPEQARQILSRLQQLKISIKKDEDKKLQQEQELNKKNQALNRVHSELRNVRKELLISGGVLQSGEFRSAVANYLRQIRDEVDYYRQNRTAKYIIKQPIRVLITGAAGQIGYSLLPLFCNGQVFGLDQPIELNLLEIEIAKQALEGVNMEIQDGSYELVRSVTCTTDPAVAFKDIDYAVLVGGFPRKQDMTRGDLLAKNRDIFEKAGEALQQYAKESTKVLVVANPANTNCLICAQKASKIPKENFSALTRLDQNRARQQLALKLNTSVSSVNNVIIWGNHSSTQVPDITFSTVNNNGKQESVVMDDEKWVDNEFRPNVQSRGKKVIETRGFSSAMSAANAVKDHLRDWHFGTPQGQYSSMAVWSDGSYDVSKGIFYSFPCICSDGKYSIVKNLRVTDTVKQLMKTSEKELLDERSKVTN